MLHLSKKEDYAIVLLSELAKNYKERTIPLSEIAREYRISPLFLRNLAFQLRKAGIIAAKEGKNGGYFLKKDPKELRVSEILQTFNNKPLLECCSESSKCSKEKVCKVSSVWKKVNVEFLQKISNLTFSEFMRNK